VRGRLTARAGPEGDGRWKCEVGQAHVGIPSFLVGCHAGLDLAFMLA
jgi:hypothetical protein